MSKWILLHQGSRFFDYVANQIGENAMMISVEELVKNVQVEVDLEKKRHLWYFKRQAYDLSKCIIMHEIFYAVKKSLKVYHPVDQKYVESAWQAYLLSTFYSQNVLNPICYNGLSISYYQMKTVLRIAHRVGLMTPSISLFKKPSFDAIGYAYLWFQPHGKLGQEMYVETMQKPWLYVPFVYHDTNGLWLGMTLPKNIVDKLRIIIRYFQLSYGEFYFQKGEDYVFYGVCPKISEQQYEQAILSKIAVQLRRYYAKI